MNDPVLFREIATGGGMRFGAATLNAPAALNALSLDMVRLLTPRLRDWAADPAIAGLVLDAAGDKALCAGGDLRQLYQTLRTCGPHRNPYAERFFGEEYALDHLIHTYPKPLLCWGHGIVMGGGIGLLAGASHRVVTPQSRLAMPETGIGLYPDVGGSWFLRRMPGRVGLFLALTGAHCNAGDALFAGLADHLVPHECKADVLARIAATAWADGHQANRATLSRILQTAGQGTDAPPSRLRAHAGHLDALMAGDDLAGIAARLGAVRSDDPWLQGAAESFARGSPTSAALAFALRQRAQGLSLAEVLRLEYRASLGCCAHHDFAEGIRALLVDKDRRPRWRPATLADVTPAFVDDHLLPRGEMAPELAGLA